MQHYVQQSSQEADSTIRTKDIAHNLVKQSIYFILKYMVTDLDKWSILHIHNEP